MECRLHYYETIKTVNEPTVRTREEAFNLVLDLHNDIRKRLNKKPFTKEDVISYFHYMNNVQRYKYASKIYRPNSVHSCVLVVIILRL